MSVVEEAQVRKIKARQVIVHSYWAVKEILEERSIAALAELQQAQIEGKQLAGPAARLILVTELLQQFAQIANEGVKNG